MSNQITKKVKKDLKEYEQTKPTQLELFELDEGNKDDYSNTIDLYDQMPKYYFGGVERDKGKRVDSLPIVEREFKHRGGVYNLTLSPAAVIDQKSGKTVHYYPSQREELVEDAIRRMAVVKNKGLFLDKDAAVKFTLYEIQKELKRNNHGYAINEIKDAIEICNKSIIEVESRDSRISYTSNIFPFVAKETCDIDEGKNQYVVMFHPLVTKSIDKGTYRLINYRKMMSCKMMIARWLHRRISHNFTGATPVNPYSIKLSTIVRDSGMKKYERNSDSIKQITKALEELVKVETLADYQIEKNLKGRAILDATFILYVSNSFVSDVKKANKLSNLQLERVEEFDLDKLEEVLIDEELCLSKTIIVNILAKVKNKKDYQTVIDAIAASKEYAKIKPEVNITAVVKKAIREGWQPKEKEAKTITHEDSADLLSQSKTEKNLLKVDRFSVWKRVQNQMKKEFGKKNYDKWLRELKLHLSDDTEVDLSAPSKFIRDWVKREYLPTVEKMWYMADDSVEKVRVVFIEEG